MPRPRRRLLVVLVVAAVVLVAVATGLALAGGDDGSSRYRTAVAVRGEVESTVSGSGTITAVNRASLGFPVGGTVASVPATVGRHVTIGQTLATLDTTGLKAQLTQAQSTLATARNRLASDRSGQTAATGRGGSTSGQGGTATGSQPRVTGSAYEASGPQVAPAVATGTSRVTVPAASTAPPADGRSIADLQAQLLADQHRTDTDLAAATSALAAATTACRVPGAQPSAFLGDVTGGVVARPATMSSSPTPTPTPSADGTSGDDTSGDGTAGAGSSDGSSGGSTSAPTHPRSSVPPDGGGSSGMSAACASALESSLERQATVAQDQQTVAADVAALDKALAAATRAGDGGPGTATPPGGSGTGAGTGTNGAGGTGTGGPASPHSEGAGTAGGAPAGGSAGRGPAAAPGTGQGSGSTPGAGKAGSTAPRTGGTQAPRTGGGAGGTGGSVASAAQLAADQAEVDADEAAVAVAQQSLDQATIVSPIDGTVGAVNLKAGQKVAAATEGQIVVLGPGSDEVTVDVNDVTVGTIKVGQTARVTPNGATAPLTGTVTSVGLLDTAAGGSPAAYPVTIGLPGAARQPDGRGASVAVVTAHVADTVAVPSSAVRSDGASRTVTLLSEGRTRQAPVQVGAVGAGRTQILSGVEPGDSVVIAELTRPLPSVNLRSLGGRGPGG